jgi:hypothetical protein
MATQIKHGDHLVVQREWYTHHAIYMGKGRVVHFAPDPQGRVKKSVRRSSFKEFLNNSESVSVRQYKKATLAAEETCNLAREIAKRSQEGDFSEYDLAENNCEHLATYCKTGKRKSAQVDEWEKGIRQRKLNRSVKEGRMGWFTALLLAVVDEFIHIPSFEDVLVEKGEVDRILRKC